MARASPEAVARVISSVITGRAEWHRSPTTSMVMLPDPSPSWFGFALASAFFAGLTAILAKLGVATLNSNLAILIRTLVVLMLTTIVVSLRGEWQRPADLSSRGLTFLVASGIATGLSWLCYFRALQLAPASVVAPVDKLSVAFAIVLGVAVLGEPVSWRTVLGGTLIVAGALVIATG